MSASNQVVPAGSGRTDIAVPSREVGRGLENVERSDVNLPRIQLDGKNGGFKMVSGTTVMSQITIVPLFFAKSRILFGNVEEGDQEGVMCRSANHLYPTDYDPDALHRYGIASPPASCSECNFAKWGSKDERTGKSKAPRCRLCFNFLVVTETGSVAILSLHGTSLTGAKGLLTTAKGERGDFWTKTYTLGTTECGAGTRKYHTLTIISIEDTPVDALSQYEALYAESVGSNPRIAGELMGGGRGDAQDSDASAALRPSDETVPEEDVPF